MKILIVSALMFVSGSTLAHEGAHGPDVTMAPQGGKLEKTSSLFLELLKQDSEFKVFAYSHESMEGDKKPLTPSELTVVTNKSSLIDGKSKKTVDFKLEPQGDHYALKFKGNSHRYELKLVVSYKGKEEKPIKWQIEP